jgi:hypothetical protein
MHRSAALGIKQHPFIDYDHDGFPPATLPSYEHRLSVTWNEILWAAITVGRPDLYHVFEHGDGSLYEAIFRWSLMRMSLEQRGPVGTRLYRTDAFKHLDPTEKGAIGYFLGLVVCKLFAAKRLDSPWTLHLDVWRDILNPVLLPGRSRPDMVAQSDASSDWHALNVRAAYPLQGLLRSAKPRHRPAES